MKTMRILLICLMIFCISVISFAKDITLTWDAPEPDPNVILDHYIIQIAEWLSTGQGGPYTTIASDIPIETQTYTATGLEDNKFYLFQIYAISTQGMRSLASNVATDQEFFFPNPAQNATIQQ